MNMITRRPTTKDLLIQQAKRGERIPRQPESLHDEQKPGPCPHKHGWRTIVCNSVEDVVECPDCGAQRVMICNFDDDFD